MDQSGLLDFWTLSIVRISNGPNKVGVSLPSCEDGHRFSFLNAMFSSTQNSGRWTKYRNAVTLCVIYHRQNPSESILWTGN
jgi:hypothetical protein